MLELVGTIVAIDEDLSQPVTHTVKLTNVKRITGDQCAGEVCQILFLNPEESRRLSALMPEGHLEGEREFVYQPYTAGVARDCGALLCQQEIPGITHPDVPETTFIPELDDPDRGRYFVCDTVLPTAAAKLAHLLGGTLRVNEVEDQVQEELVLEGDWVDEQKERNSPVSGYSPFMPSGFLPRDDFEDAWRKVKGRDVVFRAHLTAGEELRGRCDALEQKDIFLRQGADSVRIELVESTVYEKSSFS